ncbi:MAG: hypothetical protein HYU39_06845 [Thaumarchaeota archaeon]|nr:hypothetical protein [Nitrososphaerota archaeon]MBI4128397.1 hypothetical protein [Parcubacteria group bacterium]
MASRNGKLPEEMLAEARRQLQLYEKNGKEIHLRQACEKGWGASVQAVFRELGRKPRRHRETLQAFETVSLQRKDDFIARMGATADGLHNCFYHADTPPRIVEASLKDVERLISTLKDKRKAK